MQLQETRKIVQGISGAADTIKDNETADVVAVVDDASNDGEGIAMRASSNAEEEELEWVVVNQETPMDG